MEERAPVPLAVHGLAKRFGGTVALEGVDVEVRRGEIHALLGENGAGKSTLIKLLAGVFKADRGRVLLNGVEVDPTSVGSSSRIAFVHQELGLVGSMTVAENIALVSGYGDRKPFIRWRAVRRDGNRHLSGVAHTISPERLVVSLTPAEQSLVAIARAMSRPSRVLVLDEPTATLPESDVAELLSALTRLRADGVAILYVTHRLDEVFRVADRVTVLRNGRRIVTAEVGEIDSEALVRAIVGKEPVDVQRRGGPTTRQALLKVTSLVTKGGRPLSFEVGAGEIVGLVGLRGAGHEAVARTLIGDSGRRGGDVVLDGVASRPKDPAAAFRAGFGFVSGRRAEEGLATGLLVRENLFLNPKLVRPHSGRWSEMAWIGRRGERKAYHKAATNFGVRPPGAGERPIETLSGGNQQKVILARWFTARSRLLILEEPTFGVDVGARSEIYAFIFKLVERGVGVLLVSTDFEEVARIADRALVFNRGTIVASLRDHDLTVKALTTLAATQTSQGGSR